MIELALRALARHVENSITAAESFDVLHVRRDRADLLGICGGLGLVALRWRAHCWSDKLNADDACLI